ncbi:hypothetical protein LB506_003535, partial [Fusarium annulatum]
MRSTYTSLHRESSMARVDAKLRNTKRPNLPVLKGAHHVLLAKLTTGSRVPVLTGVSRTHKRPFILVEEVCCLCIVWQSK